MRIAQAGANGEDRPVGRLSHVGDSAQSLNDSVVMNHDFGLVSSDRRDKLANAIRQVERLRLPVPWKILATAVNRAIVADKARAADADKRGERVFILFGEFDQLAEHLSQLCNHVISTGSVVSMPPENGRTHPRSREILGLLQVKSNEAGPDVGAADIDGKDAVMPGEDPAWCQLHATHQAGLIRMIANGFEFDGMTFSFQKKASAADSKLSQPARPEPTADQNGLCLTPLLEPQEPANDGRKFLCKILGGAVNESCGFRLAVNQHLVQLFLLEVSGRYLAQRIL